MNTNVTNTNVTNTSMTDTKTSANELADRMILLSGLRFYTRQCRVIPTPVVSKHFQMYKLTFWSALYLSHRLQANMGVIICEGIVYQVVLEKNLTRGQIIYNASKDSTRQYALSFRKPLDEYAINGVVYISIPSNKGTE